jgi:hypothetical protein
MALARVRPAVPRAGNGKAAPLLAYFGHHKCASTWLNDIARELCASAGIEFANVHSTRQFEGDLQSFVLRKQLDFLAYSNANHKYVSALDDFRGFHVIRDPRDIVASSYFSHLHSHPTSEWPELEEHRRNLQAVDKERGLFVVIDFLEDVFQDIATWDYTDPRVLELKMEDVVQAPGKLLTNVFVFLGLVDDSRTGMRGEVVAVLSSLKRRRPSLVPFRLTPLPPSVVNGILGRNTFAVKANGRAVGIEDVGSHYRKGVPGDWVNHFGPGHKEYFKARYGDLLISLGYEDDLDW